MPRNILAELGGRLTTSWLRGSRNGRTTLATADRTYTDVFSHGYLLTNGPSTNGVPGDWSQVGIGPFRCSFEHQTEYHLTSGPSCQVLLIGQAVDPSASITKLNSIGSRIAAEHRTKGLEGAIRYVAYLAGRFTCYIYAEQTLTVIPDCVASQSIYWYEEGGITSISTHAYLLALHRDRPVDQATVDLVRKRKEIQPKYTVHMPGLRTSYEGVKPVFANCLLSIPAQHGRPVHRRFYPFQELPGRDYSEAFDPFNRVFVECVRLLSRLGPLGVSLTAGVDSRSTFAVAKKVIPGGPQIAFNYINLKTATPESHDDLYLSSRLAREAGVPFFIVRTDRPQDDQRFDEMFAKSFPTLPQARGIARALYEDVPPSIYELTSTVAEIGSAFYKNRTEPLWGTTKLASVYGHSPDFGSDPDFLRVFEEYVEYTELTPENSFGLDPYDMFYWEHRMTRWAANRYHETDLGHRVLMPYNSREMVEIMLSVPLEHRMAKEFQKSLIAKYE